MFSKNVNALIREVHHISPDLMIYALPQITKMLKLPDSDSRLHTVNLLCDMYEDAVSQVGGTSFSEKNFTELMGRCRDKDPRVRRRLISLCVALMMSKNNVLSKNTRSFVQSSLQDALMDPDATVRDDVGGAKRFISYLSSTFFTNSLPIFYVSLHIALHIKSTRYVKVQHTMCATLR